MMQNYWYMSGHDWASPFGGWLFPFGVIGFGLLLVWSLYWKARALWRAARKEDKRWFIALLVLNTLGILEILYLYVFSKRGDEKEKN